MSITCKDCWQIGATKVNNLMEKTGEDDRGLVYSKRNTKHIGKKCSGSLMITKMSVKSVRIHFATQFGNGSRCMGRGRSGTVSGESLPAGQRVSVVHTVKRAYFLIWHFKLFRYCLKTLEHAKSWHKNIYHSIVSTERFITWRINEMT